MLSPRSSRRIEAMRLPLIVGVIFIHAGGVATALQPVENSAPWALELAKFVIHLLSQEIARTAVPLFFAISGYLFFLKDDGTTALYVQKLKSRARRLLLPFIIWNLIVLGLFLLAETIPFTARFFSGGNKPISQYGLTDFFAALLGIGRPPAAYQFWFIRDLMIIVVITPVIRLLLRHFSAAYLTVLVAAWLVIPYAASPLSLEGLLFFSAGAFLAVSGRDFFALDRFGSPLVCLGYLTLCTWLAVARNPELDYPVHKLGVLLGAVCLLNFSQFFDDQTLLGRKVITLGSASFFVFAFHEPLLTFVRKLSMVVAGGRPLGLLLAYFLSIVISLLICLLMQRTLQVHASRLEAVLSGR